MSPGSSAFIAQQSVVWSAMPLSPYRDHPTLFTRRSKLWPVRRRPANCAYVGSWIKALKEEPREIFRAAADAEKIAGYLIELRQERKTSQTASTATAQPPGSLPERGYWQRGVESGRQIQTVEAAAKGQDVRQPRSNEAVAGAGR